MVKYKDDLPNGYVNGYYVGKRAGAKIPDALAEPGDDGYDLERNFIRQGTVMQDAANPGVPELIADDEEEGD